MQAEASAMWGGMSRHLRNTLRYAAPVGRKQECNDKMEVYIPRQLSSQLWHTSSLFYQELVTAMVTEVLPKLEPVTINH